MDSVLNKKQELIPLHNKVIKVAILGNLQVNTHLIIIVSAASDVSSSSLHRIFKKFHFLR